MEIEPARLADEAQLDAVHDRQRGGAIDYDVAVDRYDARNAFYGAKLGGHRHPGDRGNLSGISEVLLEGDRSARVGQDHADFALGGGAAAVLCVFHGTRQVAWGGQGARIEASVGEPVRGGIGLRPRRAGREAHKQEQCCAQA